MAKAPFKILRENLGDARVVASGARATVRPATVDDLCRAVELLAAAKCSMSTSTNAAADVLIDRADLTRVVEINEADRYVTVEAGITWRALAEALAARRLRAAVGGPLGDGSELVGDGLDGNLHFFGAGQHGTLNDAVRGLDVVLADGALVETGSAAAEGRTPFMRYFGPDLTGLFLGDGGAFGVKARVTLPIEPLPAAEGYLSLAFERFEDVAAAHVAAAREHLLVEAWGLDPDRNDLLAARGHRALEGVTFSRNGAIPLRGDRKRATAPPALIDGHRIVQRGGWSFHAVVEGVDARDADAKVAQLRKLLLPGAMRELPPAIPAALRTRPFDMTELKATRFGGQRSGAALFPLSRATELAAVTDEYFFRHRDEMARHEIAAAFLTGSAGAAFSIEATLSWRPERTAAGKAAAVLIGDLELLWGAFGGTAHNATGYRDGLSTAALRLATSVKAALDPKGLMSPGALGFGGKQAAPAKSKFAEFPQDLLKERLP